MPQPAPQPAYQQPVYQQPVYQQPAQPQAVYQQPVQPQVVYQQPAQPQKPQISKGRHATGTAGKVFSVLSFIFGLLFILASIIFVIIALLTSVSDGAVTAGFSVPIVMIGISAVSLFAFFGLLGIILCAVGKRSVAFGILGLLFNLSAIGLLVLSLALFAAA